VLSSAGVKLFLAVQAEEAFLVISVLLEQNGLCGVHSLIASAALVATTAKLGEARVSSSSLLLTKTSLELLLTVTTALEAESAIHFILEHGTVGRVALLAALGAG